MWFIVVCKNKFSSDAVVFCNEVGRPFVMQSLGSLDELYEHAKPIEEQFVEFGKHLEQLTGGEFKLGPLKEFETAREKVDRDCNGKATLINDIVRAKIVVDSPEGIEKLIDLLDPDHSDKHEIFKKFGAHCAQLNNHFLSPKLETGYRCANAKISFPLKNVDGSKAEEQFLVELQIVHEAIENVYDKTHKHMRKAQNIVGRYRHEQIPNEQAMRVGAHYAVCKFFNGQAARKAGLDCFLTNKNDALTSDKEERFKSLIRAYRLD